MLRNKSIFQISTLICLTSISIYNLLIDLPSYISKVGRVLNMQTCRWTLCHCPTIGQSKGKPVGQEKTVQGTSIN
jgi:hypothetical protein